MTSIPTVEKSPPPDPEAGGIKTIKSKEQVEYLLTHWSGYITHQTAKTLDRFWPRVFDGWHERWPATPTPAEVREYGSTANAILTLRVKNNEVRTTNAARLVPLTIFKLRRNFVLGFITVLVPQPSPPDPTYVSIKLKNGSWPPLKPTAPTLGNWVSRKS